MKHRLVHLDFLRGLAALLVCVGHLRAFLLVPYQQIKSPNLLERIFYFATGLGHQAVMIFFVLSGFLVGGSVISAYQRGNWSWRSYALRRMTRLWMVLIPALMLTLLWDGLGEHQTSAGYNGNYRATYNSGPAPESPADLRPATLLGNVFFLQTISANCYGTNGPLWSLANEFWYYLLFPLLCGIVISGGWWARIACGTLTAAMLFWLPVGILLGGLVWFMGAGAFVLAQNQTTRRWAAHPLWLLTGVVLAFGMLAISRTGYSSSDVTLLLGGGFAVLVVGLAVRSGGPRIYARLSAAVSEFSYTLYLVHFPPLALLFYVVFKGQQMPPGFSSALCFAVILTAVLIYVAVIWWCFERNTDQLRKWMEQRWR